MTRTRNGQFTSWRKRTKRAALGIVGAAGLGAAGLLGTRGGRTMLGKYGMKRAGTRRGTLAKWALRSTAKPYAAATRRLGLNKAIKLKVAKIRRPMFAKMRSNMRSRMRSYGQRIVGSKAAGSVMRRVARFM